jgi:hypothetical protein
MNEHTKIIDEFNPFLKELLSPLLFYTTVIHAKVDPTGQYLAVVCTEPICVSKSSAADFKELISYVRFVEIFPALGRTIIKFRK